jgi:Holliday junction resolvasome RuvABC endonuclease subunit
VTLFESPPLGQVVPPSNAGHDHPEATRCADYGCTAHQPQPPRVLALDLSLTATGICTPEGALATLKPYTKGDERLLEIPGAIMTDHAPRAPDLVVMEDVPFGMRNAAAGALGMLHGAVRHQLLAADWPYLTVPPATLKTYATGRGNAPKPDLRMELYKRAGIDVADDNQVDAAWLRYLVLDLLGWPVLELPKTHRRALDKLTPPAGS